MSCTNSDYAVRITRIGNTEGCITVVRSFFSFKTLITVISCGGHYNNSALDKVFTLIADWRATTGNIAVVVWYRQAEVGSVNSDEVIAIV